MLNLSVSFSKKTILKDISFNVPKGGVYGILGQSGAGKSVLLKAIGGLLSENACLTGKIYFDSSENLIEVGFENTYGNMPMIFQAAQAALDPSRSIRDQLYYLIKRHSDIIQPELIEAKATELLNYTSYPIDSINKYPHEISGGMAQRAMISMVLACNAPAILADEPTSGLDSIAREQLLALFEKISSDYGTTIVLVSHDSVSIKRLCKHILVLREGGIYAEGELSALRKDEYVRTLLS